MPPKTIGEMRSSGYPRISITARMKIKGGGGGIKINTKGGEENMGLR